MGAHGEFRTGGLRIDVARRRLVGPDGDVHLAPLEWSLLDLLVAREGQVVPKADIGRRLWPDRPFSEYALSRAVHRLRVALGDDARRPRFVKTVHGVGFQWIAEPVPAPPTSSRPFVGRDRQVGVLAAAAAAAQAGDRTLVVVDGELGSGKTRLLEEFVAGLGRAWTVARGRCPETSGPGEPYGPWLDLIEGLARTDPVDTRRALRRFAPTWLAHLPWLAAPDDHDVLVEAQRLSSRTRMVRELARLLEERASAAPLVLVLDDLHWADPATVEAVEQLASPDDAARILLVVGLRRGEAVATGHPSARLGTGPAGHGVGSRVELGALSMADLAELAAEWLPDADPSTRARAARRLVDWTAGNPLFAVTILEHLAEDLTLLDGGDAPMPGSLDELVDGLLDRLHPDDRALVETVALAEPRATASQVATVASREDAEVERRLDGLARTSPLVVASVDGDGPPAYQMAHAVHRRRTAGRLGAVVTERLHHAIACMLEDGDATVVDHARVARHFSLGGDPRRAAPHWVAAGKVAMRRFAPGEALASHDRALRALEAGWPAGGATPDPSLEVEVRLGLALAQLNARGSSEERTRDNLDRLQALVEPLADRPEAFPVWRATLLVNNLAGRTDRVRAMAPVLYSMARERGRPHELVDAHHSMGEAALHADDLATSLRHFDEADARFTRLYLDDDEADRGRTLSLRDIGARIKSARAGVLYLLGRHDEVHGEIAAAQALSQDGLNTPLVRVGNATICASILFLMDDWVGAARFAERARSIADGDNADFVAVATVIRAATGTDVPTDEVRAAADLLLARPAIPFPLGPVVLARAGVLPDEEQVAFVQRAQQVCAEVDTHWAETLFEAALANVGRSAPPLPGG